MLYEGFDYLSTENVIMLNFRSTGKLSVNYDGAYHDFMDWVGDTWYRLTFYNINFTDYTFYLDVDGVNKLPTLIAGEFRYDLDYIDYYNDFIVEADVEAYVDMLILRRHVDPEPVHGAWGEEESQTIMTVNFDDGIEDFYVDGISKGNETTVSFDPNTIANITCVVKTGYRFVKYVYDVSENVSNPFYLTMDTDYTVFAHSIAIRYLTIYFDDGIENLYINGTIKTNGTLTGFNVGQVANITSDFKDRYTFFKYMYNESTTLDNPFYLTMDSDYTCRAHSFSEGVSPGYVFSVIVVGILISILIGGIVLVTKKR